MNNPLTESDTIRGMQSAIYVGWALSLFIPGGGQFAQGRHAGGLLWFVSTVPLYFIAPFFALGWHTLCVLDAVLWAVWLRCGMVRHGLSWQIIARLP